MNIYTKGGDKGTTSLVHTKNVSKSDDRIQLVGTIDELTSHLGLVKTMLKDEDTIQFLEKIQRTLITVMAGVADPYKRDYRIDDVKTEYLEDEINRMEGLFQRPKEFILPGKCRLSAEMDVARTVARRAERALATVSVKFGADNGAKKYMNRLSDYFYVLARYVDVAKIKEKKAEAAESVQGAVRSENAGTEIVENTANVATNASVANAGGQDPQLAQKNDVQAFNVQDKTVTTTAGGNTAMAQNDSMAANTAMIQEVLKRMGIQGRITLDSAKRLIEKIEQEALRRNKPSVIAVCTPDGNPVAVHVMDGSFLVSFDMAVKKAYTSVAVKMSTMELSRLTQPGQTFYGLGKMSDNIVIFGGGVPLKVGDTIIGGLGISGGTGEEDNSLAEYGLQVLNEVL